eukprot:TRINITY_DN22353_c0_g1_i2.p1 TRINITY_DN22353_c0_g1~~TRINITY_DN22353_c0_g1_i2.p1  ORF type:complete len:188 (-),score=31.21 TRINITY_DN22353_c0_g1_i2:127-690(-)
MQRGLVGSEMCIRDRYMGKYGIIHRDLKPLNILLTDDPLKQEIKIADFGLAMILGPSEKCKSYAGTLDFCSPEVVLGIPYAQGADIWSLGVVSFYLLYGRLPFQYADDLEVRRAILKDDPPVPSDRSISPEAQDFLHKILLKNPKKRLALEGVLHHPWLSSKLLSDLPYQQFSSWGFGVLGLSLIHI